MSVLGKTIKPVKAFVGTRISPLSVRFRLTPKPLSVAPGAFIEPPALPSVTRVNESELFPTSQQPIQNLVTGAEAGYNTFLRESLANQAGYATPSSTLFLLGAASAITIGVTLAGIIPLSTVLGVATIYGLVSVGLKNKVNPHSTLGKIFALGSRVLPLAITANLLYGSFLTYDTGMMVVEALTKTFGKLPLALLGTGILTTTYFTGRDIKKALNSNMGAKNPHSPEFIEKNIILANVRISTEVLYLTYRIGVYLAFAAGAAMFHFTSPLIGIGLLAGIGWRIASSKWEAIDKLPQKAGSYLRNKNYPIGGLLAEYTTDLVIKYTPLLASTLSLVTSPLEFFCALATLYTGAWTIFGDFHAGTAAIGSALNWKRSVFNQEDLYISDASRKGQKNYISRLNPYVNENERNFSKVVNMLLMDYPYTEVNLQAETDPYGNLDGLTKLRAAREVHALLRDWQKKIYKKFKTGYDRLSLDVNSSATDLSNILEELGKQFSDINDPNSFVFRLRKEVEEKGVDYYKLPEDQPFVRQAYDAIRIHGLFFLELSKKIRDLSNSGDITHPELKEIYLEYLRIYSVRFNHVQRKLETLDDRIKTKTWNLAFTRTHQGDTLYEVWGFNPDGKFFLHFVPSTYVRIPNPEYDHTNNTKKYIWVKRENLLEILGVSQSASDRYKLVDNAPENVATQQIPFNLNGKDFTVEGFYSDEELLKPQKLLGWDKNNPVLDLITERTLRSIWIAGEANPPAGFRNKFKAWAREKYGNDYDAWIASRKDPNAIWFKDSPEALILTPAWGYNIADEAYITVNTERELQAEIRYTQERNKTIRVINYEEKTAEYPNPGYSKDPNCYRPIEHAESWRLEDAPIGIRYKTAEGEFDVPYREEETGFIKFDDPNLPKNDPTAWGRTSYGIIEGKLDEANGIYPTIVVYDKNGARLGVIQTPYPKHLPPPDQIIGRRIEIDVWPESIRIGHVSWLVADYGKNYGEKLHERLRFARLNFDQEAKQESWPNFITDIKLSEDRSRVTFTSIAPHCETYPFDKKWAGIEKSEEAEVLEVDPTGKKIYENYGSKEAKGGLILAREGENEKVISIKDLSWGLNDPQKARRVISGELTIDEKTSKKAITFSMLRRRDPIKDTPEFIYRIPPEKVETKYQKLEHLLNKHEYTAEITPEGEIQLYDENGNLADITLSAEDLKDNEGEDFLNNPKQHMDSLEDSFYQRKDKNYAGTEEYRPRLFKSKDKIMLVLTRVEKVKIENEEVLKALEGMQNPLLFFSILTSAVKIKKEGKEVWVPLSLSKPIDYKPFKDNSNIGRVQVDDPDHPGKKRYFNLPLSKDISTTPENPVYYLKYNSDAKTFELYTVRFSSDGNNNVISEEVPIASLIGEAKDNLVKELTEKGIDLSQVKNLRIDIFYTRNPEIIDGEYHSVVHAQRQHGSYFIEEAFFGAITAQFRDEYFYGVVRDLFSEAFPLGGEPRSAGLQRGKTYDRDINDKYSGKPIENGTPFVGPYSHYFEMAEVSMGLPKGALLAAGLALERNGALEKTTHKPEFLKIVIYCREKGWLAGVSEDEQEVLALALALGYYLRYSVKLTAFESQPTKFNQVRGQDTGRYNTALALGKDVLIPYEIKEISNWLFGRKEITGTWKQKFEHFLFRSWYEWPKAELARETGPMIYLASAGNIKPYIVDPFFILLWALNFASGIAFYLNARAQLGRTKDTTPHSRFSWSFIEGPRQNLSLFFPALDGVLRLFREGWQYGRYVTTALERGLKDVKPEYQRFLWGLTASQFALAAMGFAGGWLTGIIPINLSYGTNLFWAFYAGILNFEALSWLSKCETGKGYLEAAKAKISKSPKVKGAIAKVPIAKKLTEEKPKREEITKRIHEVFDNDGNKFFEAYEEYKRGNRARAIQLWKELATNPNKNEYPNYKDPNYVLLSIKMLKRLGVDLPRKDRAKI